MEFNFWRLRKRDQNGFHLNVRNHVLYSFPAFPAKFDVITKPVIPYYHIEIVLS